MRNKRGGEGKKSVRGWVPEHKRAACVCDASPRLPPLSGEHGPATSLGGGWGSRLAHAVVVQREHVRVVLAGRVGQQAPGLPVELAQVMRHGGVARVAAPRRGLALQRVADERARHRPVPAPGFEPVARVRQAGGRGGRRGGGGEDWGGRETRGGGVRRHSQRRSSTQPPPPLPARARLGAQSMRSSSESRSPACIRKSGRPRAGGRAGGAA